MPQMCWRSGKGQGNEEGRDGAKGFPALRGCSALCCRPLRAVSLLPVTLNPLSLVLQAKESIEQLVYLCQTDKEPVREAAKQSLMLCGECPAASLCSLPHPPHPKRHLPVPAGEGGPGAGPCLPRALWLIVPQALPGKSKLAAGSEGQASSGHRALSLLVIYYLLDGTERTM